MAFKAGVNLNSHKAPGVDELTETQSQRNFEPLGRNPDQQVR